LAVVLQRILRQSYQYKSLADASVIYSLNVITRISFWR